MIWNPMAQTPHFQVTSAASGASARVEYETVDDRVTTRLLGESALFKELNPRISLAGAAFSEVSRTLGLEAWFLGNARRGVEPPLLFDPTGADSSLACPPACSGPILRSWGHFAQTRSGCCMAAREGANSLCNNYLCWGCCEHFSCDAICVPDTDFFCYCGQFGRACSEPLTPCGVGGWPPSCI